ncbi:MFS transporter [Spirochaeta cellobiosiphila]|uniref:MFS transporter n=1 Tax=Spirochaeta cellobiosiphila TaxID=504483 RepID=UPI00042476CD|nr:MFS transporter [Spirochaeta cellobiosiphila]
MRIKNPMTTYKALDHRIYFMFVAQIITRMGSFVSVLLALLLTKRLGMEETTVGLILGLITFFQVFGVLAGGHLGDKIGRKNTILISHFLGGIIYIIAGFFVNNTILPLILIPASFTMGFTRPAANALVTDISSGEKRQSAMSLIYLGTNIGVAVGPILAGFLFENYPAWIFWGDGLTSLICGTLIMIFVAEPASSQRSKDSKEEDEDLNHSLRAFFNRPMILLFSFMGLILNLIYSQHSFAIPLQMEFLYPDKGAQYYGWLMSFNAIVVLCFTPLILSLTKKLRESNNVALAAMAMAIGFGLLIKPVASIILVLSALFWTWGEILFVTNFSVYVAKHTPQNHRGAFSSYSSMFLQAGWAISPIIGGMSLKYLSYSTHWTIVLVVGVILSLCYMALARYQKNKVKIG